MVCGVSVRACDVVKCTSDFALYDFRAALSYTIFLGENKVCQGAGVYVCFKFSGYGKPIFHLRVVISGER